MYIYIYYFLFMAKCKLIGEPYRRLTLVNVETQKKTMISIADPWKLLECYLAA